MILQERNKSKIWIKICQIHKIYYNKLLLITDGKAVTAKQMRAMTTFADKPKDMMTTSGKEIKIVLYGVALMNYIETK